MATAAVRQCLRLAAALRPLGQKLVLGRANRQPLCSWAKGQPGLVLPHHPPPPRRHLGAITLGLCAFTLANLAAFAQAEGRAPRRLVSFDDMLDHMDVMWEEAERGSVGRAVHCVLVKLWSFPWFVRVLSIMGNRAEQGKVAAFFYWMLDVLVVKELTVPDTQIANYGYPQNLANHGLVSVPLLCLPMGEAAGGEDGLDDNADRIVEFITARFMAPDQFNKSLGSIIVVDIRSIANTLSLRRLSDILRPPTEEASGGPWRGRGVEKLARGEISEITLAVVRMYRICSAAKEQGLGVVWDGGLGLEGRGAQYLVHHVARRFNRMGGRIYRMYRLDSYGVDTLQADLQEAETEGGFFGAVLGDMNDGAWLPLVESNQSDYESDGLQIGAAGLFQNLSNLAGANSAGRASITQLDRALNVVIPYVRPRPKPPSQIAEISAGGETAEQDDASDAEAMHKSELEDYRRKRRVRASIVFSLHGHQSITLAVNKLHAAKVHTDSHARNWVHFAQHYGIADSTSLALVDSGWPTAKVVPVGTSEGRAAYVRSLLRERANMLGTNPDAPFLKQLFWMQPKGDDGTKDAPMHNE